MHLDLYLSSGGPRVPDIHYEEMEEQDLRNAMAYLYAALQGGLQQGLDEAVVDVLREWYDEAFVALAGCSESFRKRVLGGDVFPPGGPAVRPKYIALVKEASES